MIAYTVTGLKKNSVGDLISVMRSADQDSIVKNDKGVPLSAYLNVMTGEIVIIEDDNDSNTPD